MVTGKSARFLAPLFKSSYRFHKKTGNTNRGITIYTCSVGGSCRRFCSQAATVNEQICSRPIIFGFSKVQEKSNWEKSKTLPIKG